MGDPPHFEKSRTSTIRIADKAGTGEGKAYAFLEARHYVQNDIGSHGRASLIVKARFPRNPIHVSAEQPRRHPVENRQPNMPTKHQLAFR